MSDVKKVFHGPSKMAVVDSAGKASVWGREDAGADASAVASELSSGVVEMFSNKFAMAAIKENGKVVVWGALPEAGRLGRPPHSCLDTTSSHQFRVERNLDPVISGTPYPAYISKYNIDFKNTE